jgi:putative ABC transport system permease protein
MNYAETLKLALSAIWSHKLRSFLTLLGMIIGVATFMLVLSFILGLSNYIDEKIAGIGSNAFTVRRFNFDDFKDTDTIAAAQRRNKDLTYDEFEFIRDHAQLIDKMGVKALPSREDIKNGDKKVEDVRIDAAEPIIGEIENLDIADGRYFTETENSGAMRVAFIGSEVATKLFPYGSAIGGEVSIRGIPYKVIGVQTEKGTVFGMPQDIFVQMPVKTYASTFGQLIRQRGMYFEITAKSDRLFNDAVEEARNLMRIKRKLGANEKDNFGVLTPDAISGIKNRLFGPISVVLLLVPALAVIIGSIVIMNIMLVSVTERTKEIGIRKSLGAKQTDILRQFLFEAGTLAFLGGFIGLVIAYILGAIVSKLVIQTSIPWWAGLIAISIIGVVGIGAGLYPAWKAARLDPIEALRAD